MTEVPDNLVLTIFAALGDAGVSLPIAKVRDIAARALEAAEQHTDQRTMQRLGREFDDRKGALEAEFAARVRDYDHRVSRIEIAEADLRRGEHELEVQMRAMEATIAENEDTAAKSEARIGARAVELTRERQRLARERRSMAEKLHAHLHDLYECEGRIAVLKELTQLLDSHHRDVSLKDGRDIVRPTLKSESKRYEAIKKRVRWDEIEG